MIALELLLENDTQRSMMLAQHLDTVNQLRRKEQQQAFEEAVEKVLTNGWDKQYVIVVSDPKWHPGIIGLVANKLAETFYRPSFVISEDPEKGIGKGSARTIRGFHLANSIHEHQHLFLACGGHEMAAGFSIALEYIDEMRETLNAYASHILRPEHLHPSLHIDAEVSMEEADYAATKELTLLEPFGASHAEPLFLTRDLEMLNIQPTSNPDHCRILLRNAKGETRFAMAFGLGASLGIENIGKRADVVFSTTIDSYNGQSSLKWFIKDFCWVS
jgi:single-stranded-DNA-specific exonuclease